MKINSLSLWSLLLITITFSTSGCKKSDTCSATGLSASSIHQSDVSLQWTGGTAPYTVQYRAAGTSLWTRQTSPANTLQLTNLSSNTKYEWQVVPACSSTFSQTDTFHTLGCDPGYEGADCATETRSKYYGSWIVNGTDNAVPQVTYTNKDFTITAISTSIMSLHFVSVNLGVVFDVILNSDGTSFTLVPFTSSGYSYTGSGAFSTTSSFTLVIHELDNSTSTTIDYTFTGTK